MITAESAEALLVALKRYLAAQKTSLKAAEARHAHPPGSSRAKVTTANARWAQAAEGRDHLQAALQRQIDAMAESVSAKPAR